MTTLAEVEAMSWPALCWSCGHIHDTGKVKVEHRYSDCSCWRCPNCGLLLDDRPRRWGGCETGPALVDQLRAQQGWGIR